MSRKRGGRNKSLAVAGSFVAMLGLAPSGVADQPNALGTWVGVVPFAERNIVATVDVRNLTLGAASGEMRWLTPFNCALTTEYAGTSKGDYVLNLSGSNGGWCDGYRSGALNLHFDASAPEVLVFRLTNRDGLRPVAGKLARAP